MGIITDVILPLALAFIMFALGLGLARDDFLRVLLKPIEFFIGLFLNFTSFTSSIIFNIEIKPAKAISAALDAPSSILTTKADFCSGIIATKTPSATFLKNM